jgi:hypothetical protein
MIASESWPSEAKLFSVMVGQIANKARDQVEPRRRGRGEVHVEARMFGQPRSDGRVLVGGVVVGDQMKSEPGGDLAVDGLQKGEPRLVPMPFRDPADQLAIEIIQRRKQG